MARDFGSVATIVTTDFEALYAYKLGDYKGCLKLSTQNVHTLLYNTRNNAVVTPFEQFIQLLDDDIVSLVALTLIVDPERDITTYISITQFTLSLFLMTQCQLKLRHSLKSLPATLRYIEVAKRTVVADATLNRLILNLIERRVSDAIRKVKSKTRLSKAKTKAKA